MPQDQAPLHEAVKSVMVGWIDLVYFGGKGERAKLEKIENVVCKLKDIISEWQYIETIIQEKGFKYQDKNLLGSLGVRGESAKQVVMDMWV